MDKTTYLITDDEAKAFEFVLFQNQNCTYKRVDIKLKSGYEVTINEVLDDMEGYFDILQALEKAGFDPVK